MLLALAGALCCSKKPAEHLDMLRVSVPYEVDSLDPHLRNTVSNYVIAAHFYEPLVRISGNMALEPILAESWENPDALTWVFHLRPSVKFHNGRTLTAEDVVYSFERLQKNPTLEMRDYLQNVAEVKTAGPRTVKVRTFRPIGIFLNRLNFVLIVPADSAQEDLGRIENGTGPFRYVSRNEGSITMTRNEDYWGPKPVLRQVVFLLNRQPGQAIDDWLKGRAEFVQCNTRKLDRIQNNPEARILQRDNLYVKYLSFDLSRDNTPYSSIQPNPFKIPAVRQALSLGINRKELVTRLSFFAVPAFQAVPAFIFGYNPHSPTPPYDPDKAKTLLEQAGIRDWNVTLHSRMLFKEAGLSVQEQLGRIGVHVVLEAVPDSEFFRKMGLHETSFFLSRLGCPTGDASNLLDIAIHSPDPLHGYGSFNFGGFSDPAVDRQIEQSDEIQETENRRQVLQSVLSRVVDDSIWIPLYLDQDTYALKKSFSWEPRFDSYIFASEIKWTE